jgi:hypothetical protein
MYINKAIEYKKTGVSPTVWALDINSVNFESIPRFNLSMKGFISPEKYQEFLDNPSEKEAYIIDTIYVSVTSAEVGVTNTVGYPNIPALYEVLTTKLNEFTVTNEDGETVTETEPAHPFFGGKVINNQ